MHTEDDFKTFDDKLEVLRFSSAVHSRINDEITSDFVLSKLNQKDKQFIIEMTCNAYYMKSVFDILASRIKLKNIYNPDQKEQITKEIEKISISMFKSFMIKNYMIANLNRNEAQNTILKLLVGGKDDTTEDEDKDKDALATITEKLKPKTEKGD